LEQELGLKLFDRIAGRLILTHEGEQLLPECRVLLNYAEALGERAQLLRRGDTGILKVSASPQIIEGVLIAFLHEYARQYPNVQVKLTEGLGWPETAAMLERGETHLGQNLLRAIQPGDERFGSHPLEAVDLLAAGHPSLLSGAGESMEIAKLAQYPLLLLDSSFVFRRNFDAACRLAGFAPSIKFESRAPHTLLVMAELRHGVAVIPSAMRADRHGLRIVRLTYCGKPLRERLAIYWDKRRPLTGYAKAFCSMMAEHMRKTFPITRPSPPKAGSGKRKRRERRTSSGHQRKAG
jgi:DNA-binding transcriptional LysR family regulator